MTRVQSIPVNRFPCTIAQTMRTDSRKCPQSKYFSIFSHIGGLFPQNPHSFAASREIPAKTKGSNNSYAVENRRNVSIEHEYKLGVSLSKSVIKNYVRRPLVEISLSRKRCMIAVKLLLNTNRKS